MIKNFSLTSFIGGIVLGVGIAFLWFYGGGEGSSGQEQAALRAKSSVSGSDMVQVSDQKAGDEVSVTSLSVPEDTIVWAAVHEMNGEELGNALGAVRVHGVLSDVAIPLLRTTEPLQQYAVQLYRDDNDGEFSPSRNSAYVDFDSGERVVSYFQTTE
jgi:hypothetical protein